MTEINKPNSNTSKREIYKKVSFNLHELQVVRNSAISAGYSPNALARFIREKLLKSLSKAEQMPTLSIPAVSESAANNLRGAVTNLNQCMKVLHQLAISDSNLKIVEEAIRMMQFVQQVANLCKNYADFLAKGQNKNVIARFVLHTLDTDEISQILEARKHLEKNQHKEVDHVG